MKNITHVEHYLAKTLVFFKLLLVVIFYTILYAFHISPYCTSKLTSFSFINTKHIILLEIYSWGVEFDLSVVLISKNALRHAQCSPLTDHI